MEFLYLLLTLTLLSIMVVIHELGHFLFAKLFRVTVLEFSIGMGPAIFTTKKKNKKSKAKNSGGDLNVASSFHYDDTLKSPNISESPKNIEELPIRDEFIDHSENTKVKTDFSIRALPIGGYVSMAGEDEASEDKNAFCNKPVWKRFIITIAGAVMNILLGIACMFTLVGIESVQNQYLASNTIHSFVEGSTSNVQSEKNPNPLMAGDKIIKVENVYIHTGNELVYEIMNKGHKPVDLLVVRNGNQVLLEDVVFPSESESGATFGSYDFIVCGETANFVNIMKHAVFRSFSTVKVITDSLVDLLRGRYGADAVSGPIGMAGAVGEATKAGFSSVLYLFTLITMNLGVFNLLPLPALDGGRLIFLTIEGIFRRPIKREVEQTINTVGLMALMALMLFITVKDIFNLF